jgi:hypothetical protein
MIDKFKKSKKVKFSFGKNTEFLESFSKSVGAYCMHDDGFGFSVPAYFSMENKLRAVFKNILDNDGIFFFNISGVNIKRAMTGFSSFDEAAGNNQITEWELYMIFKYEDYKSRTVFHNGVNELVITKYGFKIKWN